jgi:hypothetical protein
VSQHPASVGSVAAILGTVVLGFVVAWPWNIPFAALGLVGFAIWSGIWGEWARRVGLTIDVKQRLLTVGACYLLLSQEISWGYDVWPREDRSTALDWILFLGHLRIARERSWIKSHLYDDGWMLHWVPGTDERWWTRPAR